jgi:hypothetical protein
MPSVHMYCNALQVKGKKAAANAQSAVKKAAGTPLKRNVANAQSAAKNAVKSAPAPVKKAGTALKRAAAEVAAPGNSADFAIEFGSDVEVRSQHTANSLLLSDHFSERLPEHSLACIEFACVSLLLRLLS